MLNRLPFEAPPGYKKIPESGRYLRRTPGSVRLWNPMTKRYEFVYDVIQEGDGSSESLRNRATQIPMIQVEKGEMIVIPIGLGRGTPFNQCSGNQLLSGSFNQCYQQCSPK